MSGRNKLYSVVYYPTETNKQTLQNERCFGKQKQIDQKFTLRRSVEVFSRDNQFR
jgi:hypothetical protein